MRMNTLMYVFVATVGLAGLAGCDGAAPAGTAPAVRINGHEFLVEIADTQADRQQGLSDRPYLSADRGMLFVFDDSRPRTFVMRRCHFDIDVAFLDEDRRIINTHTMTVEPNPNAREDQLTDYDSAGPARYVLEVNGGTFARIGAEAGTVVEFMNIPTD